MTSTQPFSTRLTLARRTSTRRATPRLPAGMAGYNLIELVIVITILGVIGVGLFSIYTTSIRGYVEASQRAEMTNSARLALERISREVRNALPSSVRASTDGNCLEFRPVQLGTSYIEIPTTAPANTLKAAAFTVPAGSWSLSIMPMLTSDGSNSDMYGPAPLATVGISSIGAPDANNVVDVGLSRSIQFPRTSPTRRLFVVGNPISFCVGNDGNLRRYNGYASTVVQPNPPAGGVLLAQRLLSGDASDPVFRYSAGSSENNAVLGIQLRLRADSDTLRYAHEVLIRNVP